MTKLNHHYSLSAQQTSFYTKSGFLELEGLFSVDESNELLSSIRLNLASHPLGRDLWRGAPALQARLLSRAIARLVFAATGKRLLRLACDQWFAPGYALQKPEKLKDLLSIQGIACALLIRLDAASIDFPPCPLGLLPFPRSQGSALLIDPSLLLHWPPLNPGVGLYCAVYSLPQAVYIQNLRDPAGSLLRQYGYGYGDLLRTDTHPLLFA